MEIAAQLAPFVTFELMPYFWNSFFSCAMTIGEQSVSAIIPKFRLLTSGASEAQVAPCHPAGKPAISSATPEAFNALRRLIDRPRPTFVVIWFISRSPFR